MNRKGIFLAGWSFLGLALVLLLQLATFLPVPMEFDRMFLLIWALGMGMLIPMLLVFSLMWRQFWHSPLSAIRSIPIWASAIVIAAFIYGAQTQSDIFSLMITKGKPSMQDGKFVSTTQRKQTQILSEQEYYELNRAWVRAWTSFNVFGYTVLSVYFLVRILRSRTAATSN